MEIVLVRSGLWNIIAGDEPMPESEEDDSRVTEWNKRDRKTQAVISLHLSDLQLPLVMLLKTSKDMRDALKNRTQIGRVEVYTMC